MADGDGRLKWVDVAGAPGSGKSTICYPIWGDKSVGWDGKRPPAHWAAFLDAVQGCFKCIQGHWSFIPAYRMNNRSLRKMSTVSRMPTDPERPVFIQAGFIQRGLGFGWRLVDAGRDVNLVRPFFETMPVSVGAVFLEAPEEVVIARNNARKLVPETAHEDRAYQVPLMREPIRIAKEVLRGRGVPVLELDVTQSVEQSRRLLVEFSNREPFDPSQDGFGGQMEVLQSPPEWVERL